MYNKYIKEILREYEKTRDYELNALEFRKKEVYNAVPKIQEIEREMTQWGLEIAKAILLNPKDYGEALESIKAKIELLKQEKAVLLTENNIPLSYLELYYVCNSCKDTGFLEKGDKCHCFKQKLINQAYDMSNMAKVLASQNFEKFNIELFSDAKFGNEKLSPKENMLDIYSRCESFVINFDKTAKENLFFYGTTGLGKTYMCNCIAKALLDKGKIVVYQTAFKILEILEDYKFNKDRSGDIEASYQLLFDCDLLIIDDLGTELTNTFTNTEIFNIINTRLIQNKKIIISTNHSPVEIADIYSLRVSSRIFGEFTIIKFYGKDLRWEK